MILGHDDSTVTVHAGIKLLTMHNALLFKRRRNIKSHQDISCLTSLGRIDLINYLENNTVISSVSTDRHLNIKITWPKFGVYPKKLHKIGNRVIEYKGI